MQISRVSSPLDIPHVLKHALKHSFLKDVHFSRIYPNNPVTCPTIVWRLVRRTLGKEGKETKMPRIRGIDASSGNDLVIFWGQWTTAVFQFDLFHTSEDEVDELMKRFELFILEARPTLRASGVDTFILQEQLTDYSLPTPKEVPQRSIRYEATMTTLYPVYQPRVHQITLSVAAGTDILGMEVTRTPDSSKDTINLPVIRIIGLGNTSDTTDFVAGIDYDLIDNSDGTATIQWLEHGLRPEAGTTYYVHYSTRVDPLSFAVTGPVTSPV